MGDVYELDLSSDLFRLNVFCPLTVVFVSECCICSIWVSSSFCILKASSVSPVSFSVNLFLKFSCCLI